VTTLHLFTIAAQMAAAVTAVALARRRTEHAPAAVALVLLALASVAQLAIARRLPPARVEPYEGGARALVYLDGAIVLGAAAVTPALALAVSLSPMRRRAAVAVVAIAWLVVSVVLAVLYPSPAVRGASLVRLYLAADLAGLLVSVGALVSWVRLRAKSTSAHAVAIFLVLLDLTILLIPGGPWRVAGASYDPIQIGITLFFAAFAAVQGVLYVVA
jgi:hypothetical protein